MLRLLLTERMSWRNHFSIPSLTIRNILAISFFSLGFVGGVPTMTEYHGNYLSIRKLRSGITSEWGREIIKRLTGESKNNIYYYETKQYLDERQAEPLIYTFFLSVNYLTVRFHYNVKVDED